MLKIDVRDSDLAPVARANPTRLEWTEIWLDVGGWVITVPTDSDAAEALATPGSGLVVTTESGVVQLSGSTLRTNNGADIAGRREISVDNDGNVVDEITFTGVDDNSWMRDRITLPEPATATYAAYSDSRSGTASTVLLGYLSANLSTTGRDSPLVLPTDPVVGSTVDTESRFDVLLDQLAHVARLGGLTFRARQSARTVAFTVAAESDLSADVVFSTKAGNVGSIVIDSTPTVATAVFVAGQGEGAARAIRLRTNGAVDADRVETFLDRRDLSTNAQLDAAGDQWLADNAGSVSIEFEPLDVSGLVFGSDYQVGDKVHLDVPGLSSTQRIVEATTTVTPDETTRKLTAGSLSPTGDAALLRAIKATRSRVSALEAHY